MKQHDQKAAIADQNDFANIADSGDDGDELILEENHDEQELTATVKAKEDETAAEDKATKLQEAMQQKKKKAMRAKMEADILQTEAAQAETDAAQKELDSQNHDELKRLNDEIEEDYKSKMLSHITGKAKTFFYSVLRVTNVNQVASNTTPILMASVRRLMHRDCDG